MIKIHGVIFWIQRLHQFMFILLFQVSFLTIQQIRLFKIACLYIFLDILQNIRSCHLLVGQDIPQRLLFTI